MGGGTRDEEFVAFVEADGPYLFRTAFFLVGERALAEDLVQGTFERVYRRWDAARAATPRAYARKVLVNLRTDTWRRTRLTDVPGDDRLPVAHADDHSVQVALRDELARALGSLSPQQRRVVVLRHVLDLPEAQVAREIGRSVGTVKAASSRGLERLRTLLTEAVPEAVDEPVFDGREALTRSRAAAGRTARRGAGLGAAAVAVCAFIALVVHGPVGVPVLDAVTGPAHRWWVETFRLPPVDGRDDGPVRDEDAVAGQDDAVGLGDLDIPGMAAPAAACGGHDLATPDATRTVPVPADVPSGDFTIVQALDAEDARPAVECVDYVPEHRVSLGTPPEVAVGSGIGSDPNVPFSVRRDGTLVAASARPDVGPGSAPITALARPAAAGAAGASALEHWQLTASAPGDDSEPRGYAGVGSPVLTDTHVAWTEGSSESGPVVVRVQEPDGAVHAVASYRPDPDRLVWKIAAGGRTLAILRTDGTLTDPDRCSGRVDLVDLGTAGDDVVRDVVTDVCAISDSADGVVVSRNPADGPSVIGLLAAGSGLRELVRLDQDTAWNHYAYLSGETLLFEWGTWIVALDTGSRDATVVREDAGWTVGASDDGVVWADGEDIYFLRLEPREGVAVPALTMLGPDDDGTTAWLDVAAAANRVVWTEHASAELERLQGRTSWSYGELHQDVVYVRTSW